MLLNNLAKAYAESGKYEQAEEMAREAVRIAEKTQNSHLSQFMANLGMILNSEGILNPIPLVILLYRASLTKQGFLENSITSSILKNRNERK